MHHPRGQNQKTAGSPTRHESWSIMLRKKGQLSSRGSRALNRQVCAALKHDRSQRATKAAEQIEMSLKAGEPKQAWQALKGWYRQVTGKAPKPCYQCMAKKTTERVELYAKVPPPGAPIPINIEPFEVNDEASGEVELRRVVRGLQNGRASGVSGIRA